MRKNLINKILLNGALFVFSISSLTAMEQKGKADSGMEMERNIASIENASRILTDYLKNPGKALASLQKSAAREIAASQAELRELQEKYRALIKEIGMQQEFLDMIMGKKGGLISSPTKTTFTGAIRRYDTQVIPYLFNTPKGQ